MTLHTEIRDVESMVDCQEQYHECLLQVLFFKANYMWNENGLILHCDAISNWIVAGSYSSHTCAEWDIQNASFAILYACFPPILGYQVIRT